MQPNANEASNYNAPCITSHEPKLSDRTFTCHWTSIPNLKHPAAPDPLLQRGANKDFSELSSTVSPSAVIPLYFVHRHLHLPDRLDSTNPQLRDEAKQLRQDTGIFASMFT